MDYDSLGRRTQLDDPDRGVELTSYNGFGQVRQVSHPASGATLGFNYDGLGRVLTKTSSDDGTDTFVWDTSPNGKGQLASTMSAFGIATSHHYDPLGRSSAVDYIVDNQTYRIDTSYDPDYGRPDTLSYPATLPGAPRFAVKNVYTSLGDLYRIRNATQGAPATDFWAITTRNLDQSLTRGVLGNGVVVNWTYDSVLGRLTDITAEGPVVNGAPPLMNLSYAYYDNGMVQRRNDTVNDRDEQFTYDSLSRLRDWTLVHGGATQTWTHNYDAIGNLKEVLRNNVLIEKNNYGNPFGGQPHTLTARQDSASGVTSMNLYDARGRLHEGLGKNIEYTAFDLPKTVTQDNQTWNLTYDAFGRRTQKSTSGQSTTYIAGVYEKRVVGPKTQHIHHIRSSGVQVQVAYDAATGKSTPSYIVKDQLGSNGLSTKADGSLESQRFYNPWGQDIQADGSPLASLNSHVHDGFTGQEHDGEWGLINFQGRMYDPGLKRFLTPDPIAHPLATQGMNPYSYVYNNPLNHVDPSGFEGLPIGDSSYFTEDGQPVIYSVPPPNKSVQPANPRPALSDESEYSGPSTSDAPTAKEIAARLETQEAQERYVAKADRARAILPERSHSDWGISGIRAMTDDESWAWDNRRYDAAFPIVGLLFDGEVYPNTPEYREARADQAIGQQGVFDLVGMVPGMLGGPSTRVKTSPQSPYYKKTVVNKALRRFDLPPDVKPRVWDLIDIVIDLAESRHPSTLRTFHGTRSLREVVVELRGTVFPGSRSHGNSMAIIESNLVDRHGRKVAGPRTIVGWVSPDGRTVRFLDFDTGGPAKFFSETQLNAMNLTEYFEAVVFD